MVYLSFIDYVVRVMIARQDQAIAIIHSPTSLATMPLRQSSSLLLTGTLRFTHPAHRQQGVNRQSSHQPNQQGDQQ
jgi:hypothetical protein